MTELCVLYIIILLNYIMSETLVLSYSHGYHDKEFKHPESLMKVVYSQKQLFSGPVEQKTKETRCLVGVSINKMASRSGIRGLTKSLF